MGLIPAAGVLAATLNFSTGLRAGQDGQAPYWVIPLASFNSSCTWCQALIELTPAPGAMLSPALFSSESFS